MVDSRRSDATPRTPRNRRSNEVHPPHAAASHAPWHSWQANGVCCHRLIDYVYLLSRGPTLRSGHGRGTERKQKTPKMTQPSAPTACSLLTTTYILLYHSPPFSSKRSTAPCRQSDRPPSRASLPPPATPDVRTYPHPLRRLPVQQHRWRATRRPPPRAVVERHRQRPRRALPE